MIAAKLAAVVDVFASVKVATAPTNGILLVGVMINGRADKTSGWAPVSATATTLAGEAPASERAKARY
jgi:hypothetical protein